MSDQQNTNTQLDDDVQGSQQPSAHRSRNFYRKRPGNDRQNQDLGEDENRAPNDDDTQPSNNSEDNNQAHDDDNTRGRGRRGGFRRGRGRGRFSRGLPFYGNFHRGYSPYTNYVNGRGGYFVPPGGYYGPQYYGNDLSEQEGYNDYPVRGNRGPRGGRGRGGRRGRVTNNENTDITTDQPQTEDNKDNTTTKRRQRKQRRNNGEASGTEQQTDGVVTDDQQQDENNKDPARQTKRKFNRRPRRSTNASQNGVENEERVKSGEPRKPRDEEAIVKNVVRRLVNKVARRLAPRNRRRSRANTKEAPENNNTEVEQSQPRNARRGGRGGRGNNRPGNGYFIEQGYYDPYGMTPYYYGMYYNNYGGRGFSGRGRGRGGRGRGRFRQRGGANKENQPEDNNEEGKVGELNSTGDKSQTKPIISEQVNQSSPNDESRQ